VYHPPTLSDLDEWLTLPPPVPEFRVDGNDRLAVLFTRRVVVVYRHSVCLGFDWKATRSLRCNGWPCLLCKRGYRRGGTDLLPVYDPAARAPGVLELRRGEASLHAQISPLLPAVRGDSPLLVNLRMLMPWVYTVTRLGLPADAGQITGLLSELERRHEQGQIDVRGIYPAVPDEVLASSSWIRQQPEPRSICPRWRGLLPRP
jgi:hypothetical protein